MGRLEFVFFGESVLDVVGFFFGDEFRFLDFPEEEREEDEHEDADRDEGGPVLDVGAVVEGEDAEDRDREDAAEGAHQVDDGVGLRAERLHRDVGHQRDGGRTEGRHRDEGDEQEEHEDDERHRIVPRHRPGRVGEARVIDAVEDFVGPVGIFSLGEAAGDETLPVDILHFFIGIVVPAVVRPLGDLARGERILLALEDGGVGHAPFDHRDAPVGLPLVVVGDGCVVLGFGDFTAVIIGFGLFARSQGGGFAVLQERVEHDRLFGHVVVVVGDDVGGLDLYGLVVVGEGERDEREGGDDRAEEDVRRAAAGLRLRLVRQSAEQRQEEQGEDVVEGHDDAGPCLGQSELVDEDLGDDGVVGLPEHRNEEERDADEEYFLVVELHIKSPESSFCRKRIFRRVNPIISRLGMRFHTIWDRPKNIKARRVRASCGSFAPNDIACAEHGIAVGLVAENGVRRRLPADA